MYEVNICCCAHLPNFHLKDDHNTKMSCAKFENVQYKNRPVLGIIFVFLCILDTLIVHISCYLMFCTVFYQWWFCLECSNWTRVKSCFRLIFNHYLNVIICNLIVIASKSFENRNCNASSSPIPGYADKLLY
jgi:hypothetical protein